MKLGLFLFALAGLAFLAMKELEAGEALAAAKKPRLLMITLTSFIGPVETKTACENLIAEWANDSRLEIGQVQDITCLPWGK